MTISLRRVKYKNVAYYVDIFKTVLFRTTIIIDVTFFNHCVVHSRIIMHEGARVKIAHVPSELFVSKFSHYNIGTKYNITTSLTILKQFLFFYLRRSIRYAPVGVYFYINISITGWDFVTREPPKKNVIRTERVEYLYCIIAIWIRLSQVNWINVTVSIKAKLHITKVWEMTISRFTS